MDPATHYLLYGYHEGRIYTLPEMDTSSEHSKLPDDFDRDIYLKLHPEVAAAGMDPATHYLLYGYHEGRIYTLPEIDIGGVYDFKPDRETILVVSHEASRTGAPILSLNLVQHSWGNTTLLLCYWVAVHFPMHLKCRERRGRIVFPESKSRPGK